MITCTLFCIVVDKLTVRTPLPLKENNETGNFMAPTPLLLLMEQLEALFSEASILVSSDKNEESSGYY